jgi:hypothetical protein
MESLSCGTYCCARGGCAIRTLPNAGPPLYEGPYGAPSSNIFREFSLREQGQTLPNKAPFLPPGPPLLIFSPFRPPQAYHFYHVNEPHDGWVVGTEGLRATCRCQAKRLHDKSGSTCS